MTCYGISIDSLRQSKDDSSLESDAAEGATIQQTLSGDGDRPYLPHLDSTVAHLLIGEVGHLDPQLLDQLVVNELALGVGMLGDSRTEKGLPRTTRMCSFTPPPYSNCRVVLVSIVGSSETVRR